MFLLKKSSRSNGCVGVEFRDNGLALALIKKTNAKPVLITGDFLPCHSFRDAYMLLTDWVKEHNLQGYLCNYVLPPNMYSMQLLEAPKVDAAELRSAAHWRVKDLIDFPIEDAVVDVFSVPEGAFRGKGEMIYAVISRKPHVEDAISLIKDSELELNAIDVPELALRNVYDVFEKKHPGLAFVRLCHHGGLVNLGREGQLYISRRLQTDVEGINQDSPEWTSIRDRLTLELQRSLDFYESQLGQAPISSMMIAPMRNIGFWVEELNQAIGVKVEGLDLSKLIDSEIHMDLPHQAQCLGAIAGALREEQQAA